MSVPNSDPYIQALRAMMNAGGCKLQGPNWRPTPEERAEVLRTITELETDLVGIEEFARAQGIGDYIRAGRESFRRMAAEELNVTCYPNQKEAFENARQTIDSFRKHVEPLASAKR